jgi:nucleotidyltransferase substrate binding protein (TIGR01987 family)
MKKLKNRRESFEQALRRLEEAVQDAESDLEIDGVIQRFEFTFELFWKSLQAYLEREGIICRSPRSCIKEAYRLELLEDEEQALRMLEDRNDTVHLYDEDASRAVYERIKSHYVSLFQWGYSRLL